MWSHNLDIHFWTATHFCGGAHTLSASARMSTALLVQVPQIREHAGTITAMIKGKRESSHSCVLLLEMRLPKDTLVVHIHSDM